MNRPDDASSRYTRRGVLRAGPGVAGLLLPHAAVGQTNAAEMPPSSGSTDPFPIPWLDKNGDRNQPAKPH